MRLWLVYSFCLQSFVCGIELQFSFHPDRDLTMSETVRKYGYPIETHSLTTQDGYILTLFRISHGKNSSGPNPRPVLFVPGTCGCSENFIVAGPSSASAYYLADRGYDVWFLNPRGNRHSRRHVRLNPDVDKEFWDFSWHEVAVYDTPRAVDYILNETNNSKLFYIGHSQGTTTFMAFVSELPDYNEKIAASVQMAPSCFLGKTKTLTRVIARYIRYVDILVKYIGFEELFPRGLNDLVNFLLKTLCSELNIFADLCKALITGGQITTQSDPLILQVIFNSSPARCGVRQLYHYGQMIVSGLFTPYDFGPIKNLIKYGSPDPPLYNLSQVISPVSLFYASSDMFVPRSGVKELAGVLPNVDVLYEMPTDDFGHTDFIFSSNLDQLVNGRIHEVFKKYNNDV